MLAAAACRPETGLSTTIFSHGLILFPFLVCCTSYADCCGDLLLFFSRIWLIVCYLSVSWSRCSAEPMWHLASGIQSDHYLTECIWQSGCSSSSSICLHYRSLFEIAWTVWNGHCRLSSSPKKKNKCCVGKLFLACFCFFQFWSPPSRRKESEKDRKLTFDSPSTSTRSSTARPCHSLPKRCFI